MQICASITLNPQLAPEQARPEDVLEPSETAEEATRRMLDAKKLSSKINYNVLAGLFDSSGAAPAADKCAPASRCGGWLWSGLKLAAQGSSLYGRPFWKSEGGQETLHLFQPPRVVKMRSWPLSSDHRTQHGRGIASTVAAQLRLWDTVAGRLEPVAGSWHHAAGRHPRR